MTPDRFGHPHDVEPATVARWDEAWEAFLRFRGTPIETMTVAADADPGFVLGPVFTAVYRLLGGAPSRSPAVQGDLDRIRDRAGHGSAWERAHADAVGTLAEGNFTAAARAWDRIAAEHGRDFAAVRFAHDLYLHVGDADGRYGSAAAALDRWEPDSVGFGNVLGNLAFACEELGDFERGERLGRAALDIDPLDTWALHAVAHVYESQHRHDDAVRLLEDEGWEWQSADLLAMHMWWHLALCYIDRGEHEKALSLFDDQLADATTAFRLADLSSLLWRVELEGGNVGARWDAMADRWDRVSERHTSAFLDLHAAMAFGATPGHAGAEPFFDELESVHAGDPSENAETFRTALVPAATALRLFRRGTDQPELLDQSAELLCEVAPHAQRIGGSIAQRDLLDRTHADALLGGSTPAAVVTVLDRYPAAPWAIRRRPPPTNDEGTR